MQTRNYRACFLTPAFLGNAEQDGQWRTPPFKHLLREWWRVAWCEANQWSNDVKALRRAEGELFGSAAEGTGHRSRVRVRLDRWSPGTLKKWDTDLMVFHPEVGKGGKRIGAHLYLGYGPLNFNNGTYLGRKDENGQFKANAAIQAGESAGLRLAFPDPYAPLLDRALALADAFGTLGGRSRNGWGSLSLETAPALGSLPLRDWRGCLDRDWPHAIGRDETGPLVWQTEPQNDWRQLMRTLATIKIGLRTQFAFPQERPPHQRIEDRHWLAYPVTHHGTKAWNRNARLPNSLRFKVRRLQNGRLAGVIFHMPHLPPPQFNPGPNRQTIEDVWRCVHVFLDAMTRPAGQRRYCDKADRKALARQTAQLNGVMLNRISE